MEEEDNLITFLHKHGLLKDVVDMLGGPVRGGQSPGDVPKGEGSGAADRKKGGKRK
jgi:hypothetical protein